MLNILIEDRHSQEGAETTMEVTTNSGNSNPAQYADVTIAKPNIQEHKTSKTADMIGPYRLTKTLGQGSYGRVKRTSSKIESSN